MARIVFDNVTLEYPVLDSSRSFRTELRRTIGGAIRREGRSQTVTIVALDGVNLVAEKGDRIGLIGRNGAGKSTVLKIIAGIYPPTSGRLTVTGHVTPMLTIGLGMDPEETGFENIYTCGLLLGLSKKEIRARLDDIVEFSELGNFLDMPMRTYSQGMQMRLGFAIATSGNPEILLIDEVIGTGDAEFAAKAELRMRKFLEQASILCLASHSARLIETYCDKALWLDQGRVVAFGKVDEVLQRYEDASQVTPAGAAI